MSDLPRRRSPAPPIPSKDHSALKVSSHYNGRGSNTPNSSRYVDNELAEAVRNSVQIHPGGTSGRSPNKRSSPPPLPRDVSIDLADELPPPLPPLPTGASTGHRGTQGQRYHHQYSSSSPDIDFTVPSSAQPRLPSAYMAEQNRNPFEEEDAEAAFAKGRALGGAATLPSRTKYQRSMTTQPPESPSKTRIRRSMSTDSYALDPAEVAAGQKKAAEDKKASRHADVIDTWDPTGLGSASVVWHHSGPYDAAAPSRNVNQPDSKAPMHAFGQNGQPAPPAIARGPSMVQMAPDLPAKDKPSEAGARRARPTSRRPEGGGLTGQYSSSMPTAGGYFPDPDQQLDEAALARKERERQREEKRRALKAAWGIDTPEPFEDFGMSPGEDSFEVPASSDPTFEKMARSPGPRTGLGGKSSPMKEDAPINEDAPIGRPMSAYRSNSNQGGTGVKRTKSLMQKIKTMRESPNVPLRGSPKRDAHDAPALPTIPSYPDGLTAEDIARANKSKTPSPGVSPSKVKRPFFSTKRSSMSGRASPHSPTGKSPVDVEGVEEGLVTSPSSGGFQLVESTQSKARARTTSQPNMFTAAAATSTGGTGLAAPSGVGAGALPPPQSAKADLQFQQFNDADEEEVLDTPADTTGGARGEREPPFPSNFSRSKGLPAPPVGPAMPTFEDLVVRRPSPGLGGSAGGGGGGGGFGGEGRRGSVSGEAKPDNLRRKPSMVKKLKEKLVK